MLHRILNVALILSTFLEATAQRPLIGKASGLEFIDTSFENASPLWYEFAEDGTLQIHLLYDHERASPNRAASSTAIGSRG